MDKVLVLGALEELGFEMTNSLLEEGYEVCGIHLQMGEEMKYDERRLEIGRNANYEEIGLSEWINQKDADSTFTLLFMNDFDENMKRIWMGENDDLKRKLQSITFKPSSTIVFIHPFSEWQKQSITKHKGNVKTFFVSLSNVEQEGRLAKRIEKEKFQSIFKAIMDLVC